MKKKTLLELRKEHKLKQRDIMDLLRIDRKTLYNWEHCRTCPDHWELQALCKLYGVKKDSVIVADRYDPWSWLPEDKTYEEWKADNEAFIKKTMAWYDDNFRRPEDKKNHTYPINDFWGRGKP